MTAHARLSSPEQILAAVPAILGFTPEQSLVLVARHQHVGSTKLGLALRADLPDTRQESVALAAQLAAPLRNNNVSRACGFVVDETGTVVEPGRRDLIPILTEALDVRGVQLVEALGAPRIAAGQPYACYIDPEHFGYQHDPRASAVTAAAVENGLPVLASRAQLTTELAPNRDVDMNHRAALIAALITRRRPDTGQERRRQYDLLHAALRAADADILPASETEIVELLTALCDHMVCDTALSDCGLGARRLWSFLVREAPAPVRAEPAALLAVVCYIGGDGARGVIALDVAQQAYPQHILAGLLRKVFEHALPPSRLAQVCIKAAADATRACHGDASG